VKEKLWEAGSFDSSEVGSRLSNIHVMCLHENINGSTTQPVHVHCISDRLEDSGLLACDTVV
jgi:hypothetical protein